MALVADINLIIVIAIIIVIIAPAYYIYQIYTDLPTTDCSRFGQSQGLPDCPAGTQNILGICYTDTWSASGGTHSDAICHVDYIDCPYTGCTHFIGSSDLPDGTVCNSLNIPGWDDTHFGPGWYLTGVGITKYCHRGGDYGVYCEDAGIPGDIGNCTIGDKYGGVCWGPEKCSDSGLDRYAICTCVPANYIPATN